MQSNQRGGWIALCYSLVACFELNSTFPENPYSLLSWGFQLFCILFSWSILGKSMLIYKPGKSLSSVHRYLQYVHKQANMQLLPTFVIWKETLKVLPMFLIFCFPIFVFFSFSHYTCKAMANLLHVSGILTCQKQILLCIPRAMMITINVTCFILLKF